MPSLFDREFEDRLIELCASGSVDPHAWRGYGSSFFMGGLAVLLAGARGFERETYLTLAEQLHPGASTVGLFQEWLDRSPISPSRFLPTARKRKGID
jgi:hypothetical protein